MVNYCILCGEEIPEDQAICNTCPAILDGLPPDHAKKLWKVIEDEEARAKLRASIREVKLQLRIALESVIAAVVDFIDTVLAVTKEADDGPA